VAATTPGRTAKAEEVTVRPDIVGPSSAAADEVDRSACRENLAAWVDRQVAEEEVWDGTEEVASEIHHCNE